MSSLTFLGNHPYIVGITAVITVFSLLGAVFARTKERAAALAKTHDELAISQRRQREQTALLKAEQQRLEFTTTQLKEAWESIKKPQIFLEFVGHVELARASINRLSIDLDRHNDQIAVYRKYIDGLRGRRAAAFMDNALIDDLNAQIDSFNRGIKRLEETSVASIDKAKAAVNKAFGDFLGVTPAQMASEFINKVLNKEKLSDIEALNKFGEVLTTSGTAIQKALREAADTGSIDAYKRALRTVLPDMQAWEEAANKMNISMKSLARSTRDYSTALLRTQKEVAKLEERLESLRTSDPHEKLRLKTDRQITSTALEYLQYSEKLAQIKTDMAATTEPAIRKKLQKQLGILTEKLDLTEDQLKLIRAIGKVNDEQLTARRDLEFIKIEGQYSSLRLKKEQQLLEIKKQLHAITPIDAIREEVRLKNERISQEVRLTELRLQRVESGDLKVADKELEIAKLKLQIEQLKASKVSPQQAGAQVSGAVVGAGIIRDVQVKQERERIDQEYEYLKQHVTRKAELDAWYVAQKANLDRQLTANERRMQDELTANERRMQDVRRQGYNDMASAAVNTLEALYAFQGQKSKQMFEVLKVAKIAEATISTYSAANKALDDPTPMPTWARFAAAAAIIAGGLANVANISSTSFGGGGSGGAGMGSGGGQATYRWYDESIYGTGWKPGEGQGQQAPGDTYVVEGDVYAQDADSFRAKVTAAVQQDIKDDGETKRVINDYA